MSNSYPTLKKRYGDQTEAIEELERETLAPLADQEQAQGLINKLIKDVNLLSQVMPPEQSDEVFKNLKELLSLHKTRLILYSALCVQRSIVETYEYETRSTLVNNLETEIDTLEEQEVYFKNQLNKNTKQLSYYTGIPVRSIHNCLFLFHFFNHLSTFQHLQTRVYCFWLLIFIYTLRVAKFLQVDPTRRPFNN